jgi:N-methylhydantoinase B/oxoprolinase/acetone carboxylase alpha subunit
MNLLNGKPIAHRVTVQVAPGDVLRIETPGGGAWGGSE